MNFQQQEKDKFLHITGEISIRMISGNEDELPFDYYSSVMTLQGCWIKVLESCKLREKWRFSSRSVRYREEAFVLKCL